MASWKGRLFNQFLSITWVAIIGGMCYTTYLTHLPLLELAYSFIGNFGYSSGYLGQLSISLILVLPMILLSSMIFYRWIEQPFMKPSSSTKEAINLNSLAALFRGKPQTEKS
jgi:peptidoglycan/LPS O-acetylase OafA/YrhL